MIYDIKMPFLFRVLSPTLVSRSSTISLFHHDYDVEEQHESKKKMDWEDQFPSPLSSSTNIVEKGLNFYKIIYLLEIYNL
jgi:hypothetical protein